MNGRKRTEFNKTWQKEGFFKLLELAQEGVVTNTAILYSFHIVHRIGNIILSNFSFIFKTCVISANVSAITTSPTVKSVTKNFRFYSHMFQLLLYTVIHFTSICIYQQHVVGFNICNGQYF